MPRKARDYSIEVVKRAFSVLEAVARGDGGLGLKEIASSLGISSNSAFRLLFTLEAAGYLEKDPTTRRFSLGFELFRLGNSMHRRWDLVECARPVLQELLAAFQETVNLGVLHQDHILYVERLESPRSLRTSNQIGSIAHVHSTSLGKAILAFLPPDELALILREPTLEAVTGRTITDTRELLSELDLVRQREFAMDDEENVVGVRCVGAPVFGRRNTVEAAISVSAPVQRANDSTKVAEMQAAVVDAGKRISYRLGSTRATDIEPREQA